MNSPIASRTRHLVLIPAYNPGRLLAETVAEARAEGYAVWVVVDGSTDGSQRALAPASGGPEWRVLVRPKNGGKGAAVLTGTEAALAEGFTHALVMDADGQHPAGRIPEFMRVSQDAPAALVCGRPVFGAEAPKARLYGRKLSVGLVRFETGGRGAADPLFGFRVYPLASLVAVLRATGGARHYDFDPEVAVRLAWAGVPAINLDAVCRYRRPDEGGVSHFRYGRDNLRMVALHARLLASLLVRRRRVATSGFVALGAGASAVIRLLAAAAGLTLGAVAGTPAAKAVAAPGSPSPAAPATPAAVCAPPNEAPVASVAPPSAPPPPPPASAPAANPYPAEPGAVLVPGRNDGAWKPLLNALAVKGAVSASFVERRWFPFRRRPLELSGEMRLSPDFGLSLHYEKPSDSLMIVDARGLLLRDARGRNREVPPDSRGPSMGTELLPVMRFDVPVLNEYFVIRAARAGDAWRFDFTPRDSDRPGGLNAIVVEGRGTQVRRLEFRHSATQRIEILVGENEQRPVFTPKDVRRYFR